MGYIDLKQLKEITKQPSMYWGNRLSLMACEECGEFIQAESKLERKMYAKKPFDDEYDHLIEEIGDVLIAMGMVMNHYCIGADDVSKAIDSKLNEERTV